jgi:hypothetical protein
MHMTATSSPTCIYCFSTTPRTKREHVISQAMGTFEHSWTLDCVCDDCNHYFSRELELALGRDSVEGLLRIEYGVKPAQAANKLLNKRMAATLISPGIAEGARIIMRTIDPDKGMVPDTPPQVGFRRIGEQEWRFLLERDLNEESVKPFVGIETEMRILGRHGTEDAQRLVRRLASLNIEFSLRKSLLDQPMAEDTSIQVRYNFTVDTVLRRAAAKITFNYAAKVFGAETIRNPAFDQLRRFVRYGEEPVQIVTAKRQSVLVGPEAATSKTHACGLQWVHDRREVIGIVTLFNYVTYWVRMCGSDTDEFAGISSRHFFDPTSRTISEAAMI